MGSRRGSGDGRENGFLGMVAFDRQEGAATSSKSLRPTGGRSGLAMARVTVSSEGASPPRIAPVSCTHAA